MNQSNPATVAQPRIVQGSALRVFGLSQHCRDNAGMPAQRNTHPPEFRRLEIPPRTYAVFEHKGRISAISATWQAIWEHAPTAGFQTADSPPFERYDENFDGRTGLGGLEIWIPVRPS